MSDRENTEKRVEEDKETDPRTESTSMEETEGRDRDSGPSESKVGTDPRSSGEKRENATQMRHESGQSSWHPVRTGVEDCNYYLKTGRCGFGLRCRFNHPPRNQMRDDTVVQPSAYQVRPHLPQRDHMGAGMVQRSPYQVRPQLPESSQMRHEVVQPGARDCRQYRQTGQCSYGPNCRFNHPPAQVLPDRVSRPICKFFQKGSCKYGSGCKLTHSMSEDGAEPMRQATTWGKKFHEKRHGEKSSSRPWKRERHADDLEGQKQKKRKVANLRIDPTFQSGEGGSQTEQRLEIPENPNVNAQENQQEQADRERQNREAQEKAEEERRRQIDNERRQARLRLERMRPRALTDNVDQVREVLPDIGIDRKEGDGF